MDTYAKTTQDTIKKNFKREFGKVCEYREQRVISCLGKTHSG